jgi:hypothetical protein
MPEVKIANLKGPKGDKGSIWYKGTGITGTNTSAAIYSASGVTYAYVNDFYINFADSNHVYICTTEGNASTAKWSYCGSIKGDTNPTTQYSVSIPASGWTASGSKYVNTVSVTGITANTQIAITILAPALASDSTYLSAFYKIECGDTAAGKITFTASEKLSVDISLILLEVG